MPPMPAALPTLAADCWPRPDGWRGGGGGAGGLGGGGGGWRPPPGGGGGGHPPAGVHLAAQLLDPGQHRRVLPRLAREQVERLAPTRERCAQVAGVGRGAGLGGEL